MSLAARVRHPRTTVRWRLTLLYGALFLASGAALLAITYTLVSHDTVKGPVTQQFLRANVAQTRLPFPGKVTVRGRTISVPRGGFQASAPVPPVVKKLLNSRAGRTAVLYVGSDQRGADLHQLVIESVIALAIMAVISTALGWVVAGRVLAPLRTMTVATQEISAASLHRRLAMSGPRDELRELADTIDELLGRLEGAFDAQRRFVANASHELRTPLTAVRAMLELVLTDPRATAQTFRSTCRQVLDESERQEELIDALLALARSQRGVERREYVALDGVVSHICDRHRADALARGVHLAASLPPATVLGDERLIERLVTNLLQNALRHNHAGGEVHVSTQPALGAATLSISNTGPAVPAEHIDRLLRPFERMGEDRAGHGNGIGLGLSIVVAVAAAHDARLDLRPHSGGGLEVTVHFPAPPGTETSALAQPEPALSAD